MIKEARPTIQEEKFFFFDGLKIINSGSSPLCRFSLGSVLISTIYKTYRVERGCFGGFGVGLMWQSVYSKVGTIGVLAI